MLNWGFLSFRNIVTIAAIVLLVRFTFAKALNAIDGHTSPTTEQ